MSKKIIFFAEGGLRSRRLNEFWGGVEVERKRSLVTELIAPTASGGGVEIPPPHCLGGIVAHISKLPGPREKADFGFSSRQSFNRR
jgi:hypothetical protein